MSDVDVESLTAMFLARGKIKSRVIEPDNKDNILSYIGRADNFGITSAELVRRCKAFRRLSVTDRELTLNGLIVAIGKSRKGSVRYSLK